ncbi:MAG TPA: LamG domain-containing protein [Flavitalea sp.]|nr:LamG domain-containing protein [Flavitalea sp.]
MKLYRIALSCLTAVIVFSMVITSCQKLARPVLGELILDPEPPPYEPLKSFWSFENNLTDAGESKLTATGTNITYVPGVTGQAAKIGSGGYILLKGVGDTVRHSNGFVGLSADTLRNLGSYTLAFWMKATGPFTDGAQGVFSISNKTQFWGNLDIFLENYRNNADTTEAFLKVHMFNANKTTTSEQWNEVKIPGVFNKWTHIAVTYNAATSAFTIYRDGQSVYNKILDGGNYGKIKFNDFNGMVLGNHQFQTTPTLTNHGPEGWARSFNGAFDQFRLYNRGLTAAEIMDLYTTKK